MISPLDEERRAVEEALGRVVDHILAGGCSGLFVLGGVGVGAWLTCNRLNRDVFELTGMYTQKLGLAGLYAACAQLGLARNIPAEPWAAVEGSDSAIIEGLLRKHGLLPTLARA